MFEKTYKKKVYIEGMSCEHCAKRVESKLKQLTNVKSVKVNSSEKVANIHATAILSNDIIVDAIHELGYDVIDIKEM